MLRNFEELGGIAVYTRELLEHLLEIDSANEYFIFYGAEEPLGTYADRPNVREVFVPCASKFLWDQVQVAGEAKRLGVDVMFSPKMSSPLFFRGRKVFAIHGAEQFVHAKEYPLADRLYVRTFLPLFAKTSSRVIALTEHAKVDLVKALGVPPERIAVTNPGTKEIFLEPVSEEARRAARTKYGLPDEFLLHVGLVWGAKNFRVFPEVLRNLAGRHPIVLAHAGKMRGWVRDESAKDVRILRLGFVPDEDLAALYQSATALVFPSLYEGFGIPLLEAMASGCPVISTNWGAMKEVCGDAALLVDSRKPEEIADAVVRLVETPGLREEMIRRGRLRAEKFSWERTARETLAILEDVKEAPAADTAAAADALPSRRPWIGKVLKVTVSLTLLGILLAQVDFAAVGATIAGARLDLLLLAFLMNHADRILQGGKWWALVRSSGARISFWQAIANTYAGNFAGQFLPSGVGGDVVRLVLLQRLGLPPIEVAASIVVERLFGLFALVSVASASVALAAWRGVDFPGQIETVTLGLFVLMGAGLLLSFTPPMERIVGGATAGLRRLPFRVPYLGKVQDMAAAYTRYAGRRATVARYFVLSILEVLLVVMVNVVVCRALGIGIPLVTMMLVVPVTLIVYRIPISLNGLGVQEGVLGYFFAQAGYGIEAGVSLSIVLRLLEAGIFLPGAFFLWRGRKKRADVV